jgi:hypothetical protein
VTDVNIHVIPKRFFASSAEAEFFQYEIERRVIAARSTLA